MTDSDAVSARARSTIEQLITRHELNFVRATFCDTVGITRCKAVSARSFANKLSEGVSLSRAQMALNVLDELVFVEGVEPVGEIRLVPDVSSFVVLPWRPDTASVMCDQVSHSSTAWEVCPRRFLKRVVDQFDAEGITAQISFEPEFYLVLPDANSGPGYTNLPRPPVYSSIGHEMFADLLGEICSGLEAQGIEVEQAINEYGAGQVEISVRHRDPVAAADQAVRIRDTARAYASKRGLVASFAAKPFPRDIGSGQHLHMSLWNRQGESLFYDRDESGGLSATGRSFVAGLLTHLPALIAVTTPSFNSYRRLEAGQWASSTTSWGYDNREAAVRVSSPFRGRESGSFNIEFKPCDGSANPYIALGCVLLAGLDGIRRQLEPPPACANDPARVPADEWEERGLRSLPNAMNEALTHLLEDSVLRAGMGAFFLGAYTTVRQSEYDRFTAEDLDFELRHHYDVF